MRVPYVCRKSYSRTPDRLRILSPYATSGTAVLAQRAQFVLAKIEQILEWKRQTDQNAAAFDYSGSFPFWKLEVEIRSCVDLLPCIGSKKCIRKGPDGCFLDGCPWDAFSFYDWRSRQGRN